MEIINHKGNYYIKTESGYRKVIATTDTSLKIPRKDSHSNSVWKLGGALLPQIPQSFIDTFVKEYNKDNVIDKVMVECEELGYKASNIRTGVYGIANKLKEADNTSYDNTTTKLKINPDNTINISLIEEEKKYSKSEVEELIHEYENKILISMMKGKDKWIEENLK